ncbi:hypothetical protein MPSI1_000589 [Malassezia psittaci]|uniref:TECPR1-like DysF domain-containing protein n=1 Tax=Malassezia psittaci TaxID=1821823 RepID=A0AAF0F905_9BASI|nr:hypothetical protein MPSI1_000589 [Malassezia psittaci]
MAPEPMTKENLAQLNEPTSPTLTAGESKSSESVKSGRSNTTLSRRASESMHSMIIGSMVAVKGEPPRLPTQKRKPPLSLTTTSINFRGFVQKSGPVFYFQDNVESTLMWDDWPWTVMWMGIWAVVSPAILVTILCNTYFIRFPLTQTETSASPGDALRASLFSTPILNEEPRNAPIEPHPVTEGEMQYFYNMRDIQNMMRLIIDGYDHIAPLVKYLNWSNVPRTLRLLQASVAAMIITFFIGVYIPVRPTLFLLGEAVLIMNHPWVKPSIDAMHKHFNSGSAAQKRILRKRRMMQRISDLLDEDRLPESVWEKGWRDFELYENQRFRSSSKRGRGAEDRLWNASSLQASERRPWTRASDGFSGDKDKISDKQTYQLEKGWEWIDGDDWRIDWGGSWSSVGVDENGFLYTDDSWRNPAPYAYGTDPKAPKVPARLLDDPDAEAYEDIEDSQDALDDDIVPPKYFAVTRRRRWLRRAVKAI